MPSGKLFLILGPSGVGKGTIITRLKAKYGHKFIFPVSATTRTKRPGEREGETYHFLSPEIFQGKIERDEFLEWAEVHQNNRYGTLKAPILSALEAGQNVIREMDVQGFESVQKILPTGQFVTIFLLPPSLPILKKRILRRAPLTTEELQKRLQSAEKELQKSAECDYRIQTKDRDIVGTLTEVEAIIAKELGRTQI